MPKLIKKIYKDYKKKVKKIVFNQDKSAFAIIWKTVCIYTEVNFYDNFI